MSKKRRKETVTINDIAKHLNISTSTVSRALNNNKRISQKTRNEVWTAARELNYQPNVPQFSVDLSEKSNIAVIVPEFSSGIYTEFLRGLQTEAENQDFNIIIGCSENSAIKQEKLIQNFIELGVAGIIISFSSENKDLEYLKPLINKGLPIITFNNVCFDLPVTKIVPDTFSGAYMAAEHLFSVGCRDCAIIGSAGEDPVSRDLMNGFRAGLAKNGIQLDNHNVMQSGLSNIEIESSLENLFNSGDRPDGLFVASNRIAFQAVAFLREKRLDIPGDVSIVSFGTEPLNKYFSPSISSIHFSASEIGKNAFENMLSAIEKRKNGKPLPNATIIKPVRLVIRSSSMKM